MATRIFKSPNNQDFATAANWSGDTAPVSNDTIVIRDSRTPIVASDQSAITGITCRILESYLGMIGDPTTYLQLGITALQIGAVEAGKRYGGAGRLNIDTGSAACSADIFSTALDALDLGHCPVRLKFGHSSGSLRLHSGRAAVAGLDGETSTIGTIEVGKEADFDASTFLLVGDGVTLTTLKVHGARALLRCAATTVTVNGGVCATDGAGAITTVNATGGVVKLGSTGTITTLNASNGTIIDASDPRARTITNLNMDDTCVLIRHPNLTLTNKINPNATGTQWIASGVGPVPAGLLRPEILRMLKAA